VYAHDSTADSTAEVGLSLVCVEGRDIKFVDGPIGDIKFVDGPIGDIKFVDGPIGDIKFVDGPIGDIKYRWI